MNKTQRSKLLITFISIAGTLLVYTGAVVVFLYANGWRLDFFNQQVIRTGVLTVESTPFLANIYVNGENKGRTPRSTSLSVGTYNVSVHRNGYREWRKTVEIKEEIATHVYPWLIREEIAKENVHTIENKKYINSWINETDEHILILTSTYNSTTRENLYEIWRYDVNTTFWDLSANPKVVLTFESTNEVDIDIEISPNGLLGVLSYTEEGVTTYYLLNTSRPGKITDLTVLNITPFDSYSMSWSKNNQYLMFESSSDLISFNIDKQTRYLLLRKLQDKEYIWYTDEQGYYYILETNEEIENDRVHAYTLVQEDMEGSNTKILVGDLYFQKNTDFLARYQEDKTMKKHTPFTNSTASTRSVGKVKEIIVNQLAQGIYIQTENASYWYNMRTKKYHLISPYETELIHFSPNNTKLLYRDVKGYGVFIFQKEDSNPNIVIGSKKIKNISSEEGTISNTKWLSNSLYIMYIQDERLYVSDEEGDNKIEILEDITAYTHIGLGLSRDRIFSITVDNIEGKEVISIDRYSMH
jgi:hypothetical protein